ncbi:MAG: acyl-[acyl-carrier-protein]--UDP-N-acetylglucosamine O-acyltransferase [Candidatus Puniceispirillum sp.]|nr:acyl-[acyl-carrier-protein]--UDP-N-acetylglucosamine O-acyltransferase [Candidatus Pelagibacter sp.]MBA4282764.1 acyl-[acyl-carrier-protein]--UDP-N-acetylglucosamine O-acyltransferase [Candidatus Puniceispirillum sp.]
MKNISSLASVSPKAKIGQNVIIGPFCTVGENVTLHDDVTLKSHVCIDGITTVGEGTIIYPFASIGMPPQDLKYNGEPSTVEIGSKTTIREYVTIQPGTKDGGMKTQVGDNCLLMAGVHIAHDCIVGNNVIMANYATLGGHVHIGDHAVIGGLAAFHQFVRVGEHAMVGGMSGVERDVIPYGLVTGERSYLHGLNIVGLKRRGFSTPDLMELQKTFEFLLMDNNTPLAEKIKNFVDTNPNLSASQEILIQFLQAQSKRSFTLPKLNQDKN